VTTRLLGIAGYKNSGKTTLVERLVRELCARGYRVSTVKHAHHGFDVDQEGRDSWRHRQAGASEVAVVSAKRWALVHELKGEPEPRLEEILAKMAPCDLILTEGYKAEGHAKIEVRDVALGHPELARHDRSVIAVAASGPVGDSPVPVFDRDNIAGLAEFIIGRLELPRK
jgi:molybdopterin-guanine dinucleotide biosynthesis protein B